jgi:hypothetical protein
MFEMARLRRGVVRAPPHTFVYAAVPHRSPHAHPCDTTQDDDLAVDFVTAASNLRAACYGIPQQSAFDAKVCVCGSCSCVLCVWPLEREIVTE